MFSRERRKKLHAQMVQVFSISIVEASKQSKILAQESDLSSFSFFQRSSVQEFLNFFIKTVVDRTSAGNRAKIEQDNYVAHVYVRTDGIASVIVTDALYPTRVAFSLLNKISDEFSNKFTLQQRSTMNFSSTSSFYPELRSHLTKSQDPQSSDPFMKVQKELDETKIVLHKTMGSLLERGEKLDDLVQKSDQLSAQSKMFYKTAKSTNACCVSFSLYIKML